MGFILQSGTWPLFFSTRQWSLVGQLTIMLDLITITSLKIIVLRHILCLMFKVRLFLFTELQYYCAH
jgi:hypothetical protein